MKKVIRVLLVEDDLYARNWMELLLRRDWRTEVCREVSNPNQLSKAMKDISDHKEQVDLILIDTDIPHDEGKWLDKTFQEVAEHSPKTKILFTSVAADREIAGLVSSKNFAGYVLKDEIRYSLAWAAILAAEGQVVVTESVYQSLDRGKKYPKGTVVLDGKKIFGSSTELDTERLRLLFIISMARHEFADEKHLTEDYTYGIVTRLFEEIGLNSVLTGAANAEVYFGDHPIVLMHARRAIEMIKREEGKPGKTAKLKKVKEKETLAFHLLTLPEIHKIS